MATLSKQTQILFSSAEYARLKDEARKFNTTVGELVRKAVRKVYLQKTDPAQKEAAQRPQASR